eukprot:Blabericola_migrator_1__13491@NODE_97_length_14383_cov_97_669181_g87_i0_p4_GENE_NODE_97_length_14383_cov_97_669181_g87_i0NODE_97_length_14383_cov_97_669181_g87_i0_p4_ORF_typecomplete_len337_score27_25DNA_pol_E_B/PF04042_16/6_1e24_NODE_97_length_14383_cov_97_669181_g87_i039494959
MKVEEVAVTQRQSWLYLSDVHLDDSVVVARLRRLISGVEKKGIAFYRPELADKPMLVDPFDNDGVIYPKGLVLMGNFHKGFSPNMLDLSRMEHHLLPSSSCWTIKHYTKIDEYARSWAVLYEILREAPRLLASGCRICLVPGPFDPGLPVLPRPRMADEMMSYLHQELTALCPSLSFHSLGNPFRVKQGTRSMVAIRANMYSLMIDKSNALNLPSYTTALVDPPEDLLAESLSRLILSQSHIYPIPSSFPARNITSLVEFDSFMWLHPTPNLVLIADSSCSLTATTNMSWSRQISATQPFWIVMLGGFGGEGGCWLEYDMAFNEATLMDARVLDAA